ncbi:SDR family oxidoreductase [Amorphus orientalis]|uniref:NAD(P)-dependent dehydrogenase (Short-subunit alcohol dehydrogenase family) n=1 Tax=Amorphus orientalis TaxID=649198 RepID=A0AAE3VR44_9HYPH|nr:SDR family oxidoreductase [Amorphus orientalis]MDQ0316628.1 NAD(P)-dependent dehydrogenase (short-subunit alcohol dehydrogenase family) [Amorphus orientalis]
MTTSATKTVLITGCSSGFGLETARLFHDRGWSVVATMRTPREDLLPISDRMRILPLDVTDADSIAAAVDAAGPVDVLVNNAGVGLLNAVEGLSDRMIRDVFETNTLGTIAMTRAFLPQMRERRSGVVVNVTSTVTMMSLPLLSVYTASKAAVNAFTECLALELEAFDVRARLVLPGRAPDTAFADNARERMGFDIPEAYGELAEAVFTAWQQDEGDLTLPGDVAEAVWRAATDPASPMRLPAGADAVALANAA